MASPPEFHDLQGDESGDHHLRHRTCYDALKELHDFEARNPLRNEEDNLAMAKALRNTAEGDKPYGRNARRSDHKAKREAKKQIEKIRTNWKIAYAHVSTITATDGCLPGDSA